MTGRKPVTEMSGAEFAQLTARLSRTALTEMVRFLHGYTADGTEIALACAERVQQLMAEQRAARCPS